MVDFAKLKAEFPRGAVSWRCQTLTRGGDKGLALAYIDARDVMNRLDEVCGPDGWQDRYEVHGPKTICYLSIRASDGTWITKADGAGDTDVEAEKGSLSDAFKRSAVKWGIGRYLYDIPAPWVPCESFEKNGKHYWKRWTADPWSQVRRPTAPAQPPADVTDLTAIVEYVAKSKVAIANMDSVGEVTEWWRSEAPRRRELGIVKDSQAFKELGEACAARNAEIAEEVGGNLRAG